MGDNGTSVEATVPIRVMASLLILIPALIGLSLQILLGITLYKGWRLFRERSFYVITVQIMWCDICALLIDIYAAFPMTLTGEQIVTAVCQFSPNNASWNNAKRYSHNPFVSTCRPGILAGLIRSWLLFFEYMGDSLLFYYIPLAFEGIAFNGIYVLSLFLTANRFLLFICPGTHTMLFSTKRTIQMSICIWFYVIAIIGVSNVLGCRKEFSKQYFYFWYDCNLSENGVLFKTFIYIHSYVIVTIIILMYAVIYAKLKCSLNFFKASVRRSLKQEIKYLIQTLLICSFLAVEVVSFAVVPFLGIAGYGRFYVNTLLNLILIANNMTTPIVLLTFNQDVREQLHTALQLKRTTTNIISYAY